MSSDNTYKKCCHWCITGHPANDGGLVCTYNKLRMMVASMFSTDAVLSMLVCRHYCDELDLNHASPPLPSTSQSPAQWKHEYWCLTVWPSGHSLNSRVAPALCCDGPQICDNWVINSKLGWMTHLCSVFGYYWQELLSILSQLTGC